jgi:uncharacterized coiled-coil DUF342 family protein
MGDKIDEAIRELRELYKRDEEEMMQPHDAPGDEVEEITRLRTQRDKLLEACKEAWNELNDTRKDVARIVRDHDWISDFIWDKHDSAMFELNAAIHECEEET